MTSLEKLALYKMSAFDADVQGVSVYSDYKNGNNWDRSISTKLANFGRLLQLVFMSERLQQQL
ncbi:hypothetical protein [Pseudoalteromonas sp. Xi13]|uniref:hypothetical protein n=1 Tax=Pseudoalteromonas sp. Xi13 TaxID=2490635 RepID=UPI0013DF188B|nr:hypothetical protein [Pseudoalteromonas sp. Xi13]